MAFPYKIRSKEQWDARAASSGGGDYENFLKDEYRNFAPLVGENCVRILPPSWENPLHFGIDVWVHYSVGPDKASVICLFRMKKGNCPICEERARAERAKDEEMARDLRPAKRSLVFILNKKDEAQGPMAWGMPKTLDEAILKVAKDRSTGEYYEVDSPTEGYDIYFDKEGERLNTRYVGVSLAKRPSALPDRVGDWLTQHSVPDALRWRSYDEVKRLFIGAGRGEAPDEEPTTRNVTPLRSREERRDDNGGRSNRREEPPRRTERAEPPDEYRERVETRAPVDIDDSIPPFDTDPPKKAAAAEPEEGNGRSRADQLRERFNNLKKE